MSTVSGRPNSSRNNEIPTDPSRTSRRYQRSLAQRGRCTRKDRMRSDTAPSHYIRGLYLRLGNFRPAPRHSPNPPSCSGLRISRSPSWSDQAFGAALRFHTVETGSNHPNHGEAAAHPPRSCLPGFQDRRHVVAPKVVTQHRDRMTTGRAVVVVGEQAVKRRGHARTVK